MYGDSQTASTNSSPAFNSYPTLKTLETMDSFVDLHGYRQFRNNQTVSGSGLLRFRSAPSYSFSNFENEVSNSGDSNRESVGLNLNPTIAGDFGSRSFEDMEEDNKSLVSRYCLNSQLPPQYPRRNTASQASTMADSYRVVASTGLNIPGQARTGSNHLTVPNAYSSVRSIENYQVGDDLTSFSTRFKDQTNYPSRIYENGSEHFCSWNDSSPFSRNFYGPKSEFGNQSLMLSNNMPTLSKNSVAEIAVMEKLLQFQDSVPCKIRAKRGCATHPRSIAERVRRTRISERIRKLQEIVPNMEKQTSTADMLELAVEYIKELQKQYKVLSDYKANCKCSSILKP